MIFLDNGLLNIQWNNINELRSEDITYFLFLEGKSIDSLSKIRNIDRETIQKHIIEGKIKYGILAKSKNMKELFKEISISGKQDKIDTIMSLDENIKKGLVEYIKEDYFNMLIKEKEAAVWMLGELKDFSSLDILSKASVHKMVNIRRMAVSAMGKVGNIEAEDALIRALKDENNQVVMYAIKALSKIGSKKAETKVKNIYNEADKQYIKTAAEEYFSIMEKINQ